MVRVLQMTRLFVCHRDISMVATNILLVFAMSTDVIGPKINSFDIWNVNAVKFNHKLRATENRETAKLFIKCS